MGSKSILITGANGGIGQCLCETFKKNGWNVIATDLQDEIFEADLTYISIDLNRICIDECYFEEKILEIREKSPKEGLHALINNAAKQIVAPVENLSLNDWQATFNINVIAPFFLIKNLMLELERNNGSVINISSVHSKLTKSNFSAYATSKAALDGLTRSLALEIGSRIRVNSINPAAILTPMLESGFIGNDDQFLRLNEYHPSGCIGAPDLIARAALYLINENSGFLNGAFLGLDGGIASRLFDPV